MKLLIVTQAVDTEDPILGFFVRWIEEFAKHVERIEIICLREGKHDLPENVRVHSLGKSYSAKATKGTGARLRYVWRFLSLVWRLRRDYDTVFVHMNQEYILVASPLWKLFGKRVYLWRNHYAGSWLTDLATSFCTKVFCTSKYSYTARYEKTVLMPVGIDTERFKPDERVARIPHSILSLGRIAPSKRLEVLIDALAALAHDGIEFTASIIGSPLPADEAYYAELQERVRAHALANRVTFLPGVPKSAAPDIYRAHETFVNASPSGMLDKTIFEAAACGSIVLARSKDFAAQAGERFAFETPEELAHALRGRFSEGRAAFNEDRETLRMLAAKHSLNALAERIATELY